MRIFIGINLDILVQEQIQKFLKPFKKISSPIRWVKPENIHVTLKFIGEIAEDKYTQIENRLLTMMENNSKDQTLELTLKGCGKFGKQNNLNIFWLGVEPSEELTNLYQTIEKNLEKINIAKETRAFKPHITVARNRKAFNFKSIFRLMEENSTTKIASFKATHFQLFKSELKPSGPNYTILKEIPLINGTA